MTEIADETLSLPVARFVLHWGDLGGQWGVNRSVAQIHALLYLSEKPLTAEDVVVQLSLARSNVSTSIKELLSWRLIHRVPIMGDLGFGHGADSITVPLGAYAALDADAGKLTLDQPALA